MTIQQGSQGAEVSNWQTFLNQYEAAGLTVDGVFGPGTLAATQSFQTAHALTADGVVGPNTYAVRDQVAATGQPEVHAAEVVGAAAPGAGGVSGAWATAKAFVAAHLYAVAGAGGAVILGIIALGALGRRKNPRRRRRRLLQP